MVANRRQELVEHWNVRRERRSIERVALHDVPLIRRQLTRRVQNLFGRGDFTDVVQQSAASNQRRLRRRQPEIACDPRTPGRHRPRMFARNDVLVEEPGDQVADHRIDRIHRFRRDRQRRTRFSYRLVHDLSDRGERCRIFEAACSRPASSTWRHVAASSDPRHASSACASYVAFSHSANAVARAPADASAIFTSSPSTIKSIASVRSSGSVEACTARHAIRLPPNRLCVRRRCSRVNPRAAKRRAERSCARRRRASPQPTCSRAQRAGPRTLRRARRSPRRSVAASRDPAPTTARPARRRWRETAALRRAAGIRQNRVPASRQTRPRAACSCARRGTDRAGPQRAARQRFKSRREAVRPRRIDFRIRLGGSARDR